MGSSALEVMITTTAAASLNMYCRGGDGCCGREDTRWGSATLLLGSTSSGVQDLCTVLSRLCGEGEGDCDADDQCSGQLECGTNNCATTVISHFCTASCRQHFHQLELRIFKSSVNAFTDRFIKIIKLLELINCVPCAKV